MKYTVVRGENSSLLMLYDLEGADLMAADGGLIAHTAFNSDEYRALGLQIPNLPNFGKLVCR